MRNDLFRVVLVFRYYAEATNDCLKYYTKWNSICGIIAFCNLSGSPHYRKQVDIGVLLMKSFHLNLSNLFRICRHQVARLNGRTIQYNLCEYSGRVDKIRALADLYRQESDDVIKAESLQLTELSQTGADVDARVVHAFALASEVIRRKLNLSIFDEQLIAGMVLNEGKLVQMQTGEGKTLAAVLPACLNALDQKGVLILTFNDYLAKRDANWMSPVYEALGLKVAYVQQSMSPDQRREAYGADIIYVTAREYGFDFLRDSICYEKDQLILADHKFIIVDEADSILIDEARNPLVLAVSGGGSAQLLQKARIVVEKLVPEKDFIISESRRNINLSECGIKRVEEILDIQNLYKGGYAEFITALSYALQAEYLLNNGIHYLVKDEKVILIDEFTGRVNPDRRWEDGLHHAVECKESLASQGSGVVQNSISLQHLLRLCPKLCGMSATSASSAEEFSSFYGLQVVIIPPHTSSIRMDHPDRIFYSRKERDKALIAEIVQAHKCGRPVLVGTASVNESYNLHQALIGCGLMVSILNADNDEHEAELIAKAGHLGAITISTNMAGRGTDIVLGKNDKEREQIRSVGGLYVIGTNRHDSPRIDFQLRGRTGRQGEPGETRFFISLDDPLFTRFDFKASLPKKIIEIIASRGDEGVDNQWLNNKINRIQHTADGENFNLRSRLVQYSDIIEKQRMIVHLYRKEILHNLQPMDLFSQRASDKYAEFRRKVGERKLQEMCTTILLRSIDECWSRHLLIAGELQKGVHLRSFGGNTPIFEFEKQMLEWFNEFFDQVAVEALAVFSQLNVQSECYSGNSKVGVDLPSSTWAYQTHDTLFDDMRDQLATQSGFSAIAFLLTGPLFLISVLVVRINKSRKL